MSDITPSASYFDFASLAALRGQAVQDERKALRKAAEQFESHFIQETLKAMRQTIAKSDLMESASADLYEDMMDKEVSLQLTRRGGVGIADMLERQFVQRDAQALTSTETALKARAFELNPAAASLPMATPAKAPLALPRGAAGYALPLPSALNLPGRSGAGDKP